MSLKQEIETWVEALNYYDEKDFEKALEIFSANADTSKIYFNIGMIHAAMGEHELAIEAYERATKLDHFLAVAYFQQGVSNFLLAEFDNALSNFNDALMFLRGNTMINYEQLGLKFKLYSCEVLFNRGLCYIYDGRIEEGMKDLEFAAKEKLEPEHDVIDDAIKDNAEQYTVFSIPVGILYRPNESKVRNVKAKDYLGKARLVAAADRADAFTGFTGSEIKKQQQEGEAPKDDRPIHNISWAATNLVKPDLIRNRESMPPPPAKEATGVLGGNGSGNPYPPTPPPEFSRAGSSARANSVRSPPELRPRRDDREYERERDNGYRDDYSPPARKPSVNEQPRRAASSASRRAPSRSNTAASRRRNDRPLDSYSERDGEYDDELYDMYNDTPRRSNTGARRAQSTRRSGSRARYDDDYDASDAYEGSSLDEDEFEMLTRSGSRRNPPAPQVRQLKVKCHHEDDTRMIMVDVNLDFQAFLKRLQNKFELKQRVRIKIRDEEEPECLIGVADQEDMDNAVDHACKIARNNRQEVGKLEIWVQQFS